MDYYVLEYYQNPSITVRMPTSLNKHNHSLTIKVGPNNQLVSLINLLPTRGNKARYFCVDLKRTKLHRVYV